jgi:hypothetical protein
MFFVAPSFSIHTIIPKHELLSPIAGFRLRLAGDPISSLPDRSRLVLPNVTIAKVKLAWM